MAATQEAPAREGAVVTYLYPYRRGAGWRSQGFRSRPNQGSNGPGGHTGFDQAMPVGTPLYAPADGIVRNSGWLSDNYRDNGWWLTRMGGDTLVIDCTDSFGRSDRLPTFIFAHCSDTMAEVGQRVRKGQLVALSGNTGTATTGPHVHIEALPPQWDFNNGVYGRVDPELYFDEWVDDYFGGVAAQGTITPLEEDMPLTAEDLDAIEERSYEGALRALEWAIDTDDGGKLSVFGMVGAVMPKLNRMPDDILHKPVTWYGFDGKQPTSGRTTTSLAISVGFTDAIANVIAQAKGPAVDVKALAAELAPHLSAAQAREFLVALGNALPKE